MTNVDIEQLKIRPFSPDDDIPRIVSLRLATEAVDQEGIEVNEQTLRAQLNLPGHDPLHDRWVISDPADPSALIASALIRPNPGTQIADLSVVVHPAWRHIGVGARLLSRAIERARQLNIESIQVTVNARQPDALEFLTENGFKLQGAYTELRISTGAHLPPVIFPFGYTLQTYSQVKDIAILTQAMNLSYIPLWGHQEVSETDIAAWMPDLNPDGIFLVFSEKGRVVGVSRADLSPERTLKNDQPTGYIDAPGVVPQHRRLDLYRALVLTGIAWLRDQGQLLVEMESWGDKLEVLKMYRELGFSDIRQLLCYQLDLSTPTA
jgi:mycothiol synthase